MTSFNIEQFLKKENHLFPLDEYIVLKEELDIKNLKKRIDFVSVFFIALSFLGVCFFTHDYGIAGGLLSFLTLITSFIIISIINTLNGFFPILCCFYLSIRQKFYRKKQLYKKLLNSLQNIEFQHFIIWKLEKYCHELHDSYELKLPFINEINLLKKLFLSKEYQQAFYKINYIQGMYIHKIENNKINSLKEKEFNAQQQQYVKEFESCDLPYTLNNTFHKKEFHKKGFYKKAL